MGIETRSTEEGTPVATSPGLQTGSRNTGISRPPVSLSALLRCSRGATRQLLRHEEQELPVLIVDFPQQPPEPR